MDYGKIACRFFVFVLVVSYGYWIPHLVFLIVFGLLWTAD
jgi:hypothetical protein